MKEKLQAIMESALKQIEEAVDSEKLNDARVSFLGKKGELTQVLKSLKDVAPEDRPKVGQLVKLHNKQLGIKIQLSVCSPSLNPQFVNSPHSK